MTSSTAGTLASTLLGTPSRGLPPCNSPGTDAQQMGSEGSVGHPRATASPHHPAVSTSSALAMAGRGPAAAGWMPMLQSDATTATTCTPSLFPSPGWGQQKASVPSQALAPICSFATLPPPSLSTPHSLHPSHCSQYLFTWPSSCASVSRMPGLIPDSSGPRALCTGPVREGAHRGVLRE